MGCVTYDFSGKTVLVTGASRGIGYAVAEGFVRAGARTFLLASGDGVYSAAENLKKVGDATALKCDITDSISVADALTEIGHLDVLINNAGLERVTPLSDPDDAVEDTFRRIVDINVVGTFLVTRHAVSKMTSGGRIILTGSIWSHTAVAEFSAYCASKHANLGFMRSVAHELGPRGITVNAVCPGWVKTEAALLSLNKMSESSGRSENDLLEEITGAQVIGGLLEPQDMAALYLFLASNDAKDITGQSYNLDRGEVMG
ncbi:SDR family NAD(P)-dependent oxidoreductase [Pseudohalocynthiibacter aestuariivivens]|jgi:3-hydroxybutyrate dehydrogenase|uniref:SDR family NAD(P)-dependent oxidoreductase n=1 Tax=Pseudohalocynthiibacter aestuariivivens TaxID=1591409 RepID=A0ABV5JE01_9RHOB|nr:MULTISPECIES: SDR family oxidoreductase [Pseudohalocynthiibacter]MBS9718100.1 SDR family oxidoreductase [Pseudohalocynthiibacter aestuariivivens]MCK0103311.1 SDR family oxidoreductase [Pseudohalocynthiibacter sp. F2068]